MQTPTVFQLGKLSNVLEEINKGLGAKYSSGSLGNGNEMFLSFVFPDLTNELQSITHYKNKIIEYFGLDESKCHVTFESRYSTVLKIGIDSQNLMIKVSNE